VLAEIDVRSGRVVALRVDAGVGDVCLPVVSGVVR